MLCQSQIQAVDLIREYDNFTIRTHNCERSKMIQMNEAFEKVERMRKSLRREKVK